LDGIGLYRRKGFYFIPLDDGMRWPKENKMFNTESKMALSVVAGMALTLGVIPGSMATALAQGDNARDAQIQADVHKALDKKEYSNVTASVHDSNVMLSGTVNLYAEKEDLDRRVHHVKHVKGVDNEVQVGGPVVEDAVLRDKLAKGLAYDRVGYGTTPFNAVTIGVQSGVVTLGGTVYGPPDKASALGLVENTPGVKDVVDDLQVAPLSPMDDQLRIALARTIYGDPQLLKYAYDPDKPIRILVVNGNVTLLGVVDNKMDRDLAGLRANTVSGVFKVTNNLQIAGPQSGK
jgi:hyperosmotically inducible periplasmic protein